jgi:hypothetical protein
MSELRSASAKSGSEPVSSEVDSMLRPVLERWDVTRNEASTKHREFYKSDVDPTNTLSKAWSVARRRHNDLDGELKQVLSAVQKGRTASLAQVLDLAVTLFSKDGRHLKKKKKQEIKSLWESVESDADHARCQASKRAKAP